MRPTDSFRNFLTNIYSTPRVTDILRQLEDAQESVGLETIVGGLAEIPYDSAYHLVIRTPRKPIRVETLCIGEYPIGRSPTCLIIVDDPWVSRVHCLVIVHSDGQVTLRDLQSTCGTLVNWQPLSPDVRQSLQRNDLISVGGTTITLVWM